jgi:hypothetical protein
MRSDQDDIVVGLHSCYPTHSRFSEKKNANGWGTEVRAGCRNEKATADPSTAQAQKTHLLRSG